MKKVFNSKTPKIYKNKKLNTANFGNFTHNDYQVFLHLVSKIGGVDKEGKYLQPEQLKREHVLTASEFSKISNTDIDNSYRFLSKAVEKLMKTDIKIEKPENGSIIRVNICSQAEYVKKEGRINVEFTDRIMPYLAQVKQKFVLYNLKEISNFGSIYTTRLYELIQEFKDTGYMIKSVEELRESFAVDKKFKAYKDFKKYTFDHACSEINKIYQMNLGYEEIKEGRKVIAIKFVFRKTKITKRYNQHTGVAKNVYEKPKLQNKGKKSISDVLDGQLSFENKNTKPIQNIVSSLFSKITRKE
jgi:plasmid replication initiation protein